MAEGMTSRERWMAALRCEDVDRLPFWPKINGSYARMQAEPFNGMTPDQLHEWIGSDVHGGCGPCYKEVRTKTSVEASRENGRQRMVYYTPAGNLTAVNGFDEGSQSWHPREFPVKTVADIDAMIEFHADARVEFNPDAVEPSKAAVAKLGERGVATTGIGISPLMDWLQHLAGIEQGHWLLADHPEKVEALFDVMHRNLLRRAEIAAEHSPAVAIYSVENTSTTLISPRMFRRYCQPALAAYGEIITSAGKMHMLHMCGHLKDVLPDIAALPARGIEAFTAPPVGNTTWADGRRDCPNLCLVGGTSAWLWTRSAREIIARIEHDLSELPHRRGVVVTSAGVMPPLCPPQAIREVCRWVQAQPVS